MPGSIAFIAAPYGYGPTSKAVAVASHVSPNTKCLFFGYGPALRMAHSSNVFLTCTQIDFNGSINQIIDATLQCDFVVFFNTTRFIQALAETGKRICLVETLAWLRNNPPSCASYLSGYFAQRFLGHPFSEELEALDNFRAVGAILPATITKSSSYFRQSSSKSRSPLLHCGGLFSPAMVPWADHAFITAAARTTTALRTPIRFILPQHFHNQVNPIFGSGQTLLESSPMTVHDHIAGSEFCITTTGIEFSYECLALDVPMLFLPPFNASQQCQISYIARTSPEAIVFTESSDRLDSSFANLNEVTAHLQRDGLLGKWGRQFREVENVLKTYSREGWAEFLARVRISQRREFSRISMDGSQVISDFLHQELSNGVALQ